MLGEAREGQAREEGGGGEGGLSADKEQLSRERRWRRTAVPGPASPPGPRFREVSIRGPEVTVQRQRAGDGGGAGGAQHEADPEK